METQSPQPPDAMPEEVAEAASATFERDAKGSSKPPWLDSFVWSALWKVVGVAVAAAVLLVATTRAADVLRMLIISVFFALAMIPAVNYMHSRWGWKRGAAVGFVYACLVLFVVFMIALLIPGIAQFAEKMQEQGPAWVEEINSFSQDLLGQTLIAQSSGDLAAATGGEAIGEWSDEILGFASTGIGFVFNLFTIAMFTFYFAADYPRFERAVMSRMSPQRQQVYGWISDESIEQTGGYFYSRLILGVINGGLAFVVMVLLGLSPLIALPMAVFMGFVSEFIPAIGTYIGGAVPILVTLALVGWVQALILLIWVIIYQQLENMWLSPRLSAETMELNGAVAFGSALAGGAIAGPMGAFMALPFAALITAIVKNSGKTYQVVYSLRYDSADSEAQGSPPDQQGKPTQ